MPKKLTKIEVLHRLHIRNENNPPVYLYPKSQPYVSQKEALTFKCGVCSHKWVSNYDRTIYTAAGCPNCKLKQDSIKKRRSWEETISLANTIHQNKYEYIKETYKNSKTPMKLICKQHGMFALSPFDHINMKKGCPSCHTEEKLKIRLQKFKEKANNLFNYAYDYSKVDPKKIYTQEKITIICKHHGQFKQLSGDHLQGHGCKRCSMSGVSKKSLQWLIYIEQTRNISIQHAGNIGEYAIPNTNYRCDGYDKKTNTVYEFYGDLFHGNPNKYTHNYSCSLFSNDITAGKLYRKTITRENHIKELGYNMETIWESEFDNTDIASHIVPLPKFPIMQRKQHIVPYEDLNAIKLQLLDTSFMGYKHKHNFLCLQCGSKFNTTITQRLQAYKKRGIVGCPSCKSVQKTNSNLLDLLNNQQQTPAQYKNGVIELTNDICVKVYPLIENHRKDLTDIQQRYEKKGKRLILIFNDELANNEQLIVNKLQHYCNVSKHSLIHARKCTISLISADIKNEFLNQYHIQGNDISHINYGAYYNNELIAVMTFSRPRIALGQKNNVHNHWELSRFATNINYRIPGIASKLLTKFKREQDWNRIYSYADKRWSIGNMYTVLGFEQTASNPPDYFYIIDGKRKHRWNYRKDVIKNTLPNYDPKLTEYENMKNAGFWRVWGCGTLRYEISQ